MGSSLATAFCFAFSVVLAAKSAHWLGGTLANLGRMFIALFLLAFWTFGPAGDGFGGPSLPYFLLSGMIGFGLGDLALFQALPRIGPRLTILLNQCLAVPIAVATERLWLDTRLRGVELFWSGVILCGVALALAPERRPQQSAPDGELVPAALPRPAHPARWAGVAFGVAAAFGQAWGAVLSRKASLIAENAGLPVDGGTAAFQRIVGGLSVALAFYCVMLFLRKAPYPDAQAWRKGGPWVLLNAVAGPVLGIAFYQHALATTPSGLVLPIVATSPVIAMGLAWLINRERPGWLSALGGGVAVAGAAALVVS